MTEYLFSNLGLKACFVVRQVKSFLKHIQNQHQESLLFMMTPHRY